MPWVTLTMFLFELKYQEQKRHLVENNRGLLCVNTEQVPGRYYGFYSCNNHTIHVSFPRMLTYTHCHGKKTQISKLALIVCISWFSP